jgi:flavin-dependent dehydrogenase
VAEPDVLIVGGGPAGLATAIECRMAGLRATVIDRRRPPVDVACGEGVMPAGLQRLLRLGVELSEGEASLFSGVCYRDGNLTATAKFSRGSGLGVRRTALHRALVRRAEGLDVDLRWGVAAIGLRSGGVETETGFLGAKWLVAADGRLSQVRSWAGIDTALPSRRRFGIRRHYQLAPWSDVVEVHWADEGEAYVTPVGPDTVGVAVLSRRRPLDFDRHLGLFPELANRLEGAQRASSDRGAGPFGQRAATVVQDNLALVGDASGCLDPITGEGLSVAMGQAQALVRAVRTGEVASYAAEHRRLMRAPRALTGLLVAVEARPAVRRLTMRSLAAFPRLFGRLVDVVGASGHTPDGGRTRPVRVGG